MTLDETLQSISDHKDGGGAVSIMEDHAITAWRAGNRHEAGYFLSMQDLVSSGGLAEAGQSDADVP